MQQSNGELHPIVFHSRTLNPTELNYDTHDKELLVIFEAFTIWRHYLDGSQHTIDVITDHKNLEYFATTKMLSRRQARWSEFLSVFNMVIRFCPGKLGMKPNALTRHPDVYPKRGDSDYAQVNPHNFRPIFTQEQFALSLRATYLEDSVLQAASMMDYEDLRKGIISALTEDTYAQEIQRDFHPTSNSDPWELTDSGLLLYQNRIYVPDVADLRLQVLRYKHDHPTAGHFGQTKTADLISREFHWPGMRKFVQHFCKSCIDCGRNKLRRHKP